MVASLIWRYIEKRFVFFQTSDVQGSPGDLGIDYENVYFETQDGRLLHGWYVPGSGSTTWLWFHGNGGNVGHRLPELALLHHKLKANLFLFDYGGFGNSQGTPSELGTYLDARAALTWLRQRADWDERGLIYFSHSLGGAIAVELAVHEPPSGMILVSPFASVADMSRIVCPWLPTRWLVRNRYNSLDRIPGVNCPILVVHGEEDFTVPISQGRRLYEAAHEPKRFVALTGAAHNGIFEAGGEVYWNALAHFSGQVEADGRGQPKGQ